MTGQAQAHKEFVAARLGGTDTTGDSQWKLSSHQQSSPISKGERVQHIEAFAYRNKIIVGVCMGAALLIILALIFLCRRRRRSKNIASSRSVLPANKINLNRLEGAAYRQVEDPRSAPSGGNHHHGSSNVKYDNPFRDT